MTELFEEFVKNFKLSDNALKQRMLERWNARELIRRENLAEHSHYVVCLAIEMYEQFKLRFELNVNELRLIKHALTHDSLEMLRGDILSITKDDIPEIRKIIDAEEQEFARRILPDLTQDEIAIVHLADLKACYKFVENELRNPSNDFAKNVYLKTREKYITALRSFEYTHGFKYEDFDYTVEERFLKGYKEDAGVDIILDKDVTLLPMNTTNIDLNVKITPQEGKVAFLFARTSAALKGLCVASCPIDANYVGNVSALVHNISNNIVEYKKGESFCQYVMLDADIAKSIKTKKEGKRSDSKFGGTDR